MRGRVNVQFSSKNNSYDYLQKMGFKNIRFIPNSDYLLCEDDLMLFKFDENLDVIESVEIPFEIKKSYGFSKSGEEEYIQCDPNIQNVFYYYKLKTTTPMEFVKIDFLTEDFDFSSVIGLSYDRYFNCFYLVGLKGKIDEIYYTTVILIKYTPDGTIIWSKDIDFKSDYVYNHILSFNTDFEGNIHLDMECMSNKFFMGELKEIKTFYKAIHSKDDGSLITESLPFDTTNFSIQEVKGKGYYYLVNDIIYEDTPDGNYVTLIDNYKIYSEQKELISSISLPKDIFTIKQGKVFYPEKDSDWKNKYRENQQIYVQDMLTGVKENCVFRNIMGDVFAISVSEDLKKIGVYSELGNNDYSVVALIKNIKEIL